MVARYPDGFTHPHVAFQSLDDCYGSRSIRRILVSATSICVCRTGRTRLSLVDRGNSRFCIYSTHSELKLGSSSRKRLDLESL